MNPHWFNEPAYLLNKFDQLQLAGEDYASVQEVQVAILTAGLTPYTHYQSYGDAEGLSPNLYFNRTEYLQAKVNQLNHVKQDGKTDWDSVALEKAFAVANLTAAEHFATYGWQENVNPSNDFDVSTYLEDKAAQLGNGFTVGAVKKAMLAAGEDPVGHYMAFGRQEGLHSTAVPVGEQVGVDPSRPRPGVLIEDGKTIIIHLQSPLIANSIEKEDFTVMLGGKALTVDKVAGGADKVNYDLRITLNDDSRVPGLTGGNKGDLVVLYNPAGGEKVQLATEAGLVASFEQAVENQSQCFYITERVSSETHEVVVPPVIPPVTPPVPPVPPTYITVSTLNLTMTPPDAYVPPTEVAQFVKVDLAAAAGVVSGGAYGIVTVPRLMDGKLVQKLDATGVSNKISLDIVAGATGSEITTGDAADHIALGGGVDKVNFTSLTASQLGHMDTIEKFTCATDKLFVGDAKAATPNPLINKVLFMGPLSLEGQVNEGSIQGVFWDMKMQSKTAYLLQNGKEYILVADADGDGVFSADADFAVQLLGVAGVPATVSPGSDVTGSFV